MHKHNGIALNLGPRDQNITVINSFSFCEEGSLVIIGRSGVGFVDRCQMLVKDFSLSTMVD